MAIVTANLGASANPDIDSIVDTTSYSNSSSTPPTSGMLIAKVVNYKLGGGVSVEPTISGWGLTWVKKGTSEATNNIRMTVFGANLSGSSAGVVTVSFGAETQRQCGVSFFYQTGTDVGNGVAQTFVQCVFASGTSNSPSVTLAAASNALNRPIFGVANSGVAAITPRTNWTELDELGSGGDTFGGPETQYRDDAYETTASATLGGSEVWIAVACEIKHAVAGGSNLIPLLGVS